MTLNAIFSHNINRPIIRHALLRYAVEKSYDNCVPVERPIGLLFSITRLYALQLAGRTGSLFILLLSVSVQRPRVDDSGVTT